MAAQRRLGSGHMMIDGERMMTDCVTQSHATTPDIPGGLERLMRFPGRGDQDGTIDVCFSAAGSNGQEADCRHSRAYGNVLSRWAVLGMRGALFSFFSLFIYFGGRMSRMDVGLRNPLSAFGLVLHSALSIVAMHWRCVSTTSVRSTPWDVTFASSFPASLLMASTGCMYLGIHLGIAADENLRTKPTGKYRRAWLCCVVTVRSSVSTCLRVPALAGGVVARAGRGLLAPATRQRPQGNGYTTS